MSGAVRHKPVHPAAGSGVPLFPENFGPPPQTRVIPIQTLISHYVRHILLIAMNVAFTKMSSKGQVVIPASMRGDLPEGEKLLIIRDGQRIILKPLSDLEPAVREEIIFAEKTEQALKEYSRGTYTKKNADAFIDEMKTW